MFIFTIFLNHITDRKAVEIEALCDIEPVRRSVRPLLPVGDQLHRCGESPLLHILPRVPARCTVVAHICCFHVLVFVLLPFFHAKLKMNLYYSCGSLYQLLFLC